MIKRKSLNPDQEEELIFIKEFQSEEIFKEDLKKKFEQNRQIQATTIQNFLQESNNFFDKNKTAPTMGDRSYLKTVPSWSLQILSNIGNTFFDQKFLDKVIFLKIVGKFIFFSLSDLRLLIYNKQTEHVITEHVQCEITSMDYNFITNLYVFGYKNGKVGFAKQETEKAHLTFDDQNKNEVFADGPITNIKMISKSDVILIMTNTNKAFFMIRTHQQKLKFKIRQLLDGSKKAEFFDELNSVQIKDELWSSGNDQMVRSTFIVTLASATLVYFVVFNLLYKNSVFEEFVQDSLKILNKIEYPMEFKNKTTTNQLPEESSVRMTELGFRTRKQTFVLSSNVQWLAESSPAFFIIWENIIQRFELSVNYELIITLTTSIPIPIVCCFFGSIEYLVCLNAEFELNLINLHKVRHHVEILSIADDPEVFTKESLFTKSGQNKVLCGHDISEKGFAALNSAFLQYFEMIDWEKYLEKLIEENAVLGVVQVLHDIISITPIPLYGVTNYQGSMRYSTELQKKNEQKFCEDLRSWTPIFLCSVLECLENKAVLNSGDIIQLVIEISIETNTFEQIYENMIDFAISSQEKTDDFELTKTFFSSLLKSFYTSKILEHIKPEFFIFLFRFTKFLKAIPILEYFLFFITSNFKLPSELSNSVKMSACNKHLNNFLYYILLVDNDFERNLNQYLQFIEELKINESEKYPIYVNSLFIYIFDLYSDQLMFKIGKTNEQIKRYLYDFAGHWFLEKCSNVFMDKYPDETIYLLNLIFKPLQSPNKGELVILRSFDNLISFSERLNIKLIQEITMKPPSLSFSLYLVTFLLSPNSMFIATEFVVILFKNLQTLLIENSTIIEKFDVSILEFVILKFQIQNHEVLKNFTDFVDFQNDFLKLSKLEIENSLDMFLELLIKKAYLFQILQLKIELSEKPQIQTIAIFLKKNLIFLSTRNANYFQAIIRELPIENVISFAEEFKNDPKTQLKILQALESTSLNGNVDKELSEIYIRILCKLQSKKVIQAIRTNTKLDINEKLKICEETNYKRGQGYCLKKISNYNSSRNIYFSILKEYFANEKILKKHEKKEILEIMTEMIDENNEIEVKTTLKALVVFIGVNSNSPELQNEFFRILFCRLFDFNVSDLLHNLSSLPEWHHLIKSKQFFEQLSSNYKNICFIQNNILLLISLENQLLKDRIFQNCRQGIFLINVKCCVCFALKKEGASELNYHSCKSMIHDVCREEIKTFSCPVCQKVKISILRRKK